MNGIHVSVGPVVEQSRLHPNYDSEADVLAVTSEVPEDCPYGVDIDGNIVLDLDGDRALASFDVYVGRSSWMGGLIQRWPRNVAHGTLIFSPEVISQKSFNLLLRFRYDERLEILRIDIGEEQPDSMLGLSENCVALLARDQLAGFLIRKF